MSDRSVYIKIINYIGSILANLNNTVQTKQHATKTTLIFKYKQDIIGTTFVVEGFLAENVQNFQVLLIQQVRTVFYISRGAVFLMR